MDEAFTLLGPDFRVLDLNQLALKIDGRPREQLIGRSLWDLAPGLEQSALGEMLRRAMEHRESFETEHHQVWPDGHSAWVEARAFPVADGIAVVYRDISERRAASDALRSSEELNRRILQSSTDCIKVLSLDGRLEFMSEGGTGVMEVENLPSLLGRKWEDFWPEQERHKVARAVTEAARGKPCRFQGPAATAKGNMRWWDVAVTPILGANGEPERLLSISRDVSPTHEAEQQLAETKRRLDAVLENTTMAVFLMDDHQHCVFANAAAERLTGFSFEQLSGRPLHEVIHHKKPDGLHYPLEECPIDRAFPERVQMQGEELFVAPDGAFYPVAFTASPVMDDRGTPIGTVIEVRNIAEEKALEEQRRRAEEQQLLLINELNHRVKNTLGIVQGLAQQSFKSDLPTEEARKAFDARLGALAAAHNLLTRKNWETAMLSEIIADSVNATTGALALRVSLEGPEIVLRPQTAVSLAMAVHELSTNAIKHGALSNDEGTVCVEWAVDRDGEGPRLHLEWRERDGPLVMEPPRRGFGSRMIERGLAAELRGTVVLDFRPDGLRCRISAPLPENR